MWVRIRCCVPAWHALACSRPHNLHADVAVQLQQGMYAPLRVQRVNLVLEVVCWCASERNTLPGTLLRAQGLTLCMPPLLCSLSKVCTRRCAAGLCNEAFWHSRVGCLCAHWSAVRCLARSCVLKASHFASRHCRAEFIKACTQRCAAA